VKRVETFLKELTELTKKHNIKVEGCGCCGSPMIIDTKSGDDLGDNLDFRANKYEVCPPIS
jgi:hypothetical protein